MPYASWANNELSQRLAKIPNHLREGLGTIAANLRKLMEAAIEAGASGIFFSCMGATTADFTHEEYARFGRPYDLHASERVHKRVGSTLSMSMPILTRAVTRFTSRTSRTDPVSGNELERSRHWSQS